MRVHALGLAVAAVAAIACDAAPTDAADAGVVDASCVLATVNSDYLSSSVSLLRADGSLCAAAVITSGSRPPGVVTALSGDVALPSTPHPDGLLTLIDRYPAAVLTFYDVDAREVVGQLPVGASGPGASFPANPHDVLFLPADRAYVSRYDPNPHPTPAPGDHDEGGDLLIVDLATRSSVGRIDLSAAASPGMEPRPDRLAPVGDRVWVALGNLSRAFDGGGPGVVVSVDPARDEVVGRLELAGLSSCGGALATAPSGDGAWLACTGVFARGEAAQRDASGAVFVARGDGADPVEAARFAAADLGDGRPLGHPVAALDDARAVVVALGTLGGEPDRLYLLDRLTGQSAPLGVEGEAFSLGALAVGADGVLLVADASREAPRLRRFALDAAGGATELAPIVVDPVTGLEPRALVPFRR